MGERLKTGALPLDSDEMRAVGALAQKTEIAICVGYSERVGEQVYNTLIFFDHTGKVLQNYRKTHLYCTCVAHTLIVRHSRC